MDWIGTDLEDMVLSANGQRLWNQVALASVTADPSL